jgi:di/tricarboxylate transporter
MMGALFLTGNALCLIVYGLLPAETQSRMTWLNWTIAALPSNLLLVALSIGFILARFRPESAGTLRREALAVQEAVLGRLRPAEWSNLVIVVALMAGFVTQSIHGVDAAWLAVAAIVALFVTGALDDSAFRGGVNWGFMLYLGAILGLGTIFGHVGLDRYVGDLLTPLLARATGSPTLFVLATATLAMVTSIVLRSGLIPVLVAVAMFPTAMEAGVDPWVVSFAVLLGVNMWVYPSLNVIYLTAYYGTDERAFSHEQARPLALLYPIFVLIALAVAVPYWQWLGLIR